MPRRPHPFFSTRCRAGPTNRKARSFARRSPPCAGQLKDGTIEADFAYDDLYDADGKLAGVRRVTSTGCKPLDEHLLLGERRFRTTFSKPGEADLDAIRVEVAAGVPRGAVRLVKRGSTNVSMGC